MALHLDPSSGKSKSLLTAATTKFASCAACRASSLRTRAPNKTLVPKPAPAIGKSLRFGLVPEYLRIPASAGVARKTPGQHRVFWDNLHPTLSGPLQGELDDFLISPHSQIEVVFLQGTSNIAPVDAFAFGDKLLASRLEVGLHSTDTSSGFRSGFKYQYQPLSRQIFRAPNCRSLSCNLSKRWRKKCPRSRRICASSIMSK